MGTLDIDVPGALEEYLRTSGRIEPGEPVTIEALGGGVSNRTLLVRRQRGRSWVVKQALEKLRVEVDWFSDPARSEREARGMIQLAKLAPPGAITPLIFHDAEHHVLAMEAVPEPHENWKTLLLEGKLNEDHVDQFAILLGRIHSGNGVSHEDLKTEFRDRTYFRSLRLEPYYAYAAEQVEAARTFLTRLVDETWGRREALVHGDYSPKNVLVHSGRLVLIDHEVIHFGDPAFDLGFSMTHFLSKAHHLPGHRDAFATIARRYWRVYLEALGDVPWRRDIEERAVRQTLGCLLARVAGRSPLEYMSGAERERQRAVVCGLLEPSPNSVGDLITRFTLEI